MISIDVLLQFTLAIELVDATDVLLQYDSCRIATWTSGNVWDGLFCPYASTSTTNLGMAGVGLLMAFTGTLGLFSWSRTAIVPAVFLALITGVAVATLPGVVAGLVTGIVTLVATIVLVLGIWRASR